jgi:hypothetical protein
MVLTVQDRPVLLRSFMPDAGARAVVVGYPGGVSTVFDAVNCRLSYAWSGNFLDVSPVWDNRGGSPAKVLGDTFWKAPAGCPWGLTTSETPPDFGGRAKDPAYGAPVPEGQLYTGPHQLGFQGYSTDHAGVPTFRYQVHAADAQPLDVTERAEVLHTPVGVGLARRFTLHGPARQTAWLFAAEASRPPRLFDAGGTSLPFDLGQGTWTEVAAAGRFVVLPQDGDRVLVLGVTSAPDGSRWHLQRSDGRWQTLLRLPPAVVSGPVRVDLSMRVPYRDEPALLKELLSAK